MCTADSALSNESHENLSTVPFAGTKEQEVIQPLATGLTLPTLLAVLMRAGLTHRSDSASSELMVHLFKLNCSNGPATRIMPGSNKVPPPNIVTPTTTPGLHHRKLEPEHLGAGRCQKMFFLLIGISSETVTTFTLEQDKQ